MKHIKPLPPSGTARETLLQKAKKRSVSPRRVIVSEENLELAIALFSGDITATQAASALGVTAPSAVSRCAYIIKKACVTGQCAILMTKKGAKQ